MLSNEDRNLAQWKNKNTFEKKKKRILKLSPTEKIQLWSLPKRLVYFLSFAVFCLT